MKSIRIYTIVAPPDREAASLLIETINRKYPQLHFIPICNDPALGKTWSLRIEDRLRQADQVICLVGENSWLHQGFNWEITSALLKNKPLFAMTLHNLIECIPPFVLIDKNIPVEPFDLRKLSSLLIGKVVEAATRKVAA